MLSPIIECQELELLLESRLPSHILIDIVIFALVFVAIYILTRNILLSAAVGIYVLSVYGEYCSEKAIVPLLHSVDKCAIARLCVQRNLGSGQKRIKDFWGILWGVLWHGDPTYYNPPDGGMLIDAGCIERYKSLTATTVKIKFFTVELVITIVVFLLTKF